MSDHVYYMDSVVCVTVYRRWKRIDSNEYPYVGDLGQTDECSYMRQYTNYVYTSNAVHVERLRLVERTWHAANRFGPKRHPRSHLWQFSRKCVHCKAVDREAHQNSCTHLIRGPLRVDDDHGEAEISLHRVVWSTKPAPDYIQVHAVYLNGIDYIRYRQQPNVNAEELFIHNILRSNFWA